MADLSSIQIKDLQQSPSLSNSTEIPLQRLGVGKAEKTNLGLLASYLITNLTISNYINTSVSTSVSSSIQSHVNGTDPHGDRNYSDTALLNHKNGTDPHGDRAFTSTTVSTAITNHNNAVDPHGDRAFTTTAINNHTNASDPHGDRYFTTTSITTAINNHKTAVDPHGDRGYTNTQIANLNTTLTNYVDTQFTNKIGTTIAPLNGSSKVPNNYIDILTFSAQSAFPVTGITSKLYIDTTGKDIYYWSGNAYVNLTPDVTVGNLDLTTDNVPTGSNADRKYFTTANLTALNSKVSNVINETSTDSTSIFSRKNNNVVYLKNLKTDGLTITTTSEDIILTDNKYTYEIESNINNVELLFSNTLKEDPLVYSSSLFYNITGDVFVYSKKQSGTNTLVDKFEKWTVDAKAAMAGITQEVPKVSSATIDSTGKTISGNGLNNSTLEIYDKAYNLITTTPINTLGQFSKTLTSAITDGSPIYLYTKTISNERSDKFTIYSPNLIKLKDITGLSITSDGSILKGSAERLSTIVVKDSTNIQIGTGTTSSSGFFEITLTIPASVDDVLTLTSSNSFTTTSDPVTYTVSFTTVESASRIIVNNERTSISGKAPIDSTVSIYNSSDALLVSTTADSTGAFSIGLTGVNTSVNEFRIRVEDETILSSTTVYIAPDYFIKNTEPTIVGVLIDSQFDFLYKDLIKKSNLSNFTFDLEIDENDGKIKLKGTNNTGDTSYWKAILEVTTKGI